LGGNRGRRGRKKYSRERSPRKPTERDLSLAPWSRGINFTKGGRRKVGFFTKEKQNGPNLETNNGTRSDKKMNERLETGGGFLRGRLARSP